jgi:hypothetical protein
MLLPRFTEHPMDAEALRILYETVGRYDAIPDEI